MPEQRPYQRNAASQQQNRVLARLEERREQARQQAYRAVLDTADGRFVLWDLILAAGVFRALWVPSAEIHERAGRHDFGIELMQRLQLTDRGRFQQMEREWWEREAKERAELNQPTRAATDTGSAMTGDQTDET